MDFVQGLGCSKLSTRTILRSSPRLHPQCLEKLVWASSFDRQPASRSKRVVCSVQHLRTSDLKEEDAHESSQAPQPSQVVRAVLAVMSVSMISCLIAEPAGAWGVAWRPRRHHRRLGEWGREPDLGRYSKEALFSRQQERQALGSSTTVDSQEQGLLERIAAWAEGVKAQLQQQERSIAQNRQNQQANTRLAVRSSEGGFSPWVTGALLVAGVLLVRWLWSFVRAIPWSGRLQRKGRWVRDRGLGGKMVFVADEDIPRRSAPQALGTTNDFIDVQAMTLDPWQQGSAKPDEGSTSPLWWSTPPNIYVEPKYREQAEQEAQRLVKQMSAAKISGQDYNISNLVGLRQICGETGATVDAKTQRDPMFRAAADAAATSAAESTNILGGSSPGRFLSGIAQDLRIPEKEAVNMVNAVVASRARAALIAACAGYREQDNNEVLVQLLRLAGLMTALPLPRGSAQAEMVATGLQQRATLPERQAIWLTYGCMDRPSAEGVAELLGFNPELVMPQLDKHIEEGRKAAAGRVQ